MLFNGFSYSNCWPCANKVVIFSYDIRFPLVLLLTPYREYGKTQFIIIATDTSEAFCAFSLARCVSLVITSQIKWTTQIIYEVFSCYHPIKYQTSVCDNAKHDAITFKVRKSPVNFVRFSSWGKSEPKSWLESWVKMKNFGGVCRVLWPSPIK